MEEAVAGEAVVVVPLRVAGVGIDQEVFTHAAGSVHLEDDFHVHLGTPGHLETQPEPAQQEDVAKIVASREYRAQFHLAGMSELFSEDHWRNARWAKDK